MIGTKTVRFVHLDESGTSKNEPVLVVTGIVSNADEHWLALENHLSSLADKYAPPERRDGFVFHATELFSGGKVFPREKFAIEHRLSILDELLAVPKEFNLVIVGGWIEKSRIFKDFPGYTDHQASIDAHAAAYGACLLWVERLMRSKYPGEVATLILEDRPEARKLIKELHNDLRQPRAPSWLNEELKEYYPLTRIAETCFFAKKTESGILQIADACAFAIRRHITAQQEDTRFYPAIKSRMVSYPPRHPSSNASAKRFS